MGFVFSNQLNMLQVEQCLVVKHRERIVGLEKADDKFTRLTRC